MPIQSLWIRRGIVFLVDALLLFIAWRLAYDLRFGDELSLEINSPYQTQRNLLAPWVVLFQLGIFAAFRLYLTNFRFTGVPELKKLLMATALGMGLFFLFNFFLERQETFFDLPLSDVTSTSSHVLRVPMQIIPLYFILGLLFSAGFRFSGRLWHEGRNQISPNAPATILVGTSSSCLLLHRQLVRWSEREIAEARFRPVGFVFLDDAPLEKRFAGLESVHGLNQLPELMEKTGARVVLLSSDGASQRRLAEIVDLCKGKGIRLLVVPSLADIDDEKVDIRALKRVKIQDLLFRPPVDQLLPENRQYLRGKRVLVTGAGGSIGRELVRQILLNQPEVIILVGRGENSLHEVRNLFQEQQFKLIPVICDVRQAINLAEVFDRFRPEVVFHAAAHKHVTFMEHQPLEALSNNVLGTVATAQLAHEFECERFVLISTDKAVRPSSVMGATKRLAEEMVFSIANESRTLFSVVRFGNVLGSRGSVLKVFERQIELRLPITVTDPEATRFFMTVEEAVALVLQAGSGQESGSLYLLEMGNPVKIGNLVENLLSLSGIPASERPPLKIIGLQPGEKLHEELLTQEEDATATELEKVWKAKPRLFLHEKRNAFLHKLERLLEEGDSPLAIRFMFNLVPGYTPSGLIPPAPQQELDDLFYNRQVTATTPPKVLEAPHPEQEETGFFEVQELVDVPASEESFFDSQEVSEEEPRDTAQANALIELAEQLEDALEATRKISPEERETVDPDDLVEELKTQNPDEYIGDLFESQDVIAEQSPSHEPFVMQQLNPQEPLEPTDEVVFPSSEQQEHLAEELMPEEPELALAQRTENPIFSIQNASDENTSDKNANETEWLDPLIEDPIHRFIPLNNQPVPVNPWEQDHSSEELAPLEDLLINSESQHQPFAEEINTAEETQPPFGQSPNTSEEKLEIIETSTPYVVEVSQSDEEFQSTLEEALTPEAPDVVDSPFTAEENTENASVTTEYSPQQVAEAPLYSPQFFDEPKDLISMSETSGIPCVFIALLEGVTPEDRKELFQHLATRMGSTSRLILAGVSDKSVLPDSLQERTTLLPSSLSGDAARFNAAVKSAPDNALLITIGAHVRLNMDFCDRIAEYAAANSDAFVLYPNYIEEKNGKEEIVKLHEHAGCPHERFDFGSMIIYRSRAIIEAGMFDESLKHAWEYDMQLKIMEIGLIKNVPLVLYRHKVVQAADNQSGALHSPGRGKLGGFSYVFYPEDVEKEITSVFEKGLKRIGAWIDHDFAVVPQPEYPTPLLASVVIPILNRVKFIENALRKVQQGTFQDFEVIIVDNGSTDGTIELIQRLAQEDNRIRLFHGTGGSIASALNHGIREARGKYICQLDSDDEYAPTTLEKMIGHLESHPKCGLAISYYRLMNEHGVILTDVAPITHSGYSRNQILRRDGGGAVRIFPKAVLQEFGLYDEVNYGNFGEDYDMVLKTGEKYSVDRVHEVLYHYRRHEDNTDVTRDPEMKYKNKNRSRQEALRRRIAINQKLNKA